jgi:Transposase and inactivated derivatives
VARHGHWHAHGGRQTSSSVAALRDDRVEVPWLIRGPANGESFLLDVEKILAPKLKSRDIAIMGNLGSHKNKAVRRVIRAVAAAPPFLPQYSPDLDPIEPLFFTLEYGPRHAVGRTRDALCRAITENVDTNSAADTTNHPFIRGYAHLNSSRASLSP